MAWDRNWRWTWQLKRLQDEFEVRYEWKASGYVRESIHAFCIVYPFHHHPLFVCFLYYIFLFIKLLNYPKKPKH